MFNGMTTLELLKLFAPLIGIQLLLTIFCLSKLYRDKVRFLPKVIWLMIIVFINMIGPIAYLILGRERE